MTHDHITQTAIPDDAMRYYAWGLGECDRLGISLSHLVVFWANSLYPTIPCVRRLVDGFQNVEGVATLGSNYDVSLVQMSYQGVVFADSQWNQWIYPSAHHKGCALRFRSAGDAAGYEFPPVEDQMPYLEYIRTPESLVRLSGGLSVFSPYAFPRVYDGRGENPLLTGVSPSYFVPLGLPPAPFDGRSLFSMERPPSCGDRVYLPSDREVSAEGGFVRHGGLVTVLTTETTATGLLLHMKELPIRTYYWRESLALDQQKWAELYGATDAKIES